MAKKDWNEHSLGKCTMNPILTHIALQVSDLHKSIAFYLDYCGLQIVKEREDTHEDPSGRVTWLARPGHENTMVFVLIPSKAPTPQADTDYSHLGFALESRALVDASAQKARQAGCLEWEPRQEAYPVGYYCGVRDPDGRFIEFSYGQPLGPGALSEEHHTKAL
jgi:catechol 2,3-dioxygenase-like lactoylglutathione lyase family enzyme